jgi:hypothetical protein
VGVRLHPVVTRQLHSILALDLAEGELNSIIFVAPLWKSSHVVLEKVEGVSIFYLHKVQIKGHKEISEN